ncbi:glycoside hydrolase family 6 protein [Kineococcus sp. LSe6-4]|uniref:Glucanase n=1 Tax=Kineococcus halophytocola TaxID=3234027 RepID=A0ABV4GVS0_9ACTN
MKTRRGRTAAPTASRPRTRVGLLGAAGAVALLAATLAAAPSASAGAGLEVLRGSRVLAAPTVVAGTTAGAGLEVVAAREAETLSLASTLGRVQPHPGASAGAELLIWTNGTANGTVQLPRAATHLQVVWRGDQCQGAPNATVDVDGKRVATTTVTSTTFTTLTVRGNWAAGSHRVAVGFTNDHQAGCDRNLRLDELTFAAAPVVTSPTPLPVGSNPLAGARFWVDPDSNARREATRSTGSTAAAFAKIADQPSTVWLGDWNRTQDVRGRVSDVVRAATAAGTVPVFALYAVPGRDCGNHSAGGLPDAAAYGAWIREVAAGIGTSRVVVVLEPDALAQYDCLPPTARGVRSAVLRDAVGVLAGAPGAVTYLDAGTSRWIPADTMAQRLREAGVGQARGFALNVSNFGTTDQEAAYGARLSSLLGGASYVVDTSRNGNGTDGTWCNPPGRALGAPPTASTGRPNLDALLWVKRVGESDGECGRGEPAAGTWWPSYALGLAQRARW